MSSMSKLPLRFSPEKRKWTRVGVSSSPPSKSRRVSESKSPEPNCPICLGPIDGESFANGCFHSFCRTCLFEWSKVKAECPVCRRPFDNIIFNVESPEKYEQLKVKTQRPNEFTAPSTFTLWTLSTGERYMHPHIDLYPSPSSLSIRIGPSISRSVRSVAEFFSLPRHYQQTSGSSNQAGSIEFRRRLYRDNMWAKSDDRRTRITSASFYRDNPALTHRLQPFVCRELSALINCEFEAQFLAQRVMDAVLNHDIRSRSFRRTVENYLVSNTDHFIHEFYSFATSPFELNEYDTNTTYVPRSQTNVMTTVPPVPPLGINYEVDEPDVRPPRLRNNLTRLRNAAAAESPSSSQPIACIDIADDSDDEEPATEDASRSSSAKPKEEKSSATTSTEPQSESNFNINIIDDFDNPQPGPSGMSNHNKIQVNIECGASRRLMSFCDSDDGESDIEVDSAKPHSFVPIFPSIPSEKNEHDDESTDSIIFLAEEKTAEPDVIDVSSDEDDEAERANTQTDEAPDFQEKAEPADDALPSEEAKSKETSEEIASDLAPQL